VGLELRKKGDGAVIPPIEFAVPVGDQDTFQNSFRGVDIQKGFEGEGGDRNRGGWDEKNRGGGRNYIKKNPLDDSKKANDPDEIKTRKKVDRGGEWGLRGIHQSVLHLRGEKGRGKRKRERDNLLGATVG